MKKLNTLLCGFSAVVLTGCFAAPQMRMSAPADSSEYNGMKVYVHSIENGEFAKVSDSTNFADVSELIVDSLPNLEYRIGPLDMVQVIVWEHPELTSPMGQYQVSGQTVNSEGKLFYPYAGELQVVGLTAQELRQEITKKLSDKVLNDPQVDVRVTGYFSKKAFVSGEVRNPGYVWFHETPMTIPAAIASVDGFTADADLSLILLRRNDKMYSINYKDAVQMNLPLERMLLQPEDQLYVSSKTDNELDERVFVMGEVQKAGIANMRDGKFSLMDALAWAGGLNSVYASSRSVYVIRNSSEEQIDVFHLNSKNAMAFAMADRFELQPHDIVYVDASDIATWNRLMGLILPTVQGAYIGLQSVRETQLISNGRWGK